MAGYVIWSGISISGKQNGTWGWACNYCVLKNPSMWRPCSAFKTSYLFLSLVLSILHTGHRFSHRKNAREWIWTEYGISMADSRAHSQSQGKNVELHAEKAVAQGRSSRSTCTTQNYRYSLPSYCTTGYTELRTYDSRDRQNNSRTSFLRRYIPRKQKKKKTQTNFQREPPSPLWWKAQVGCPFHPAISFPGSLKRLLFLVGDARGREQCQYWWELCIPCMVA